MEKQVIIKLSTHSSHGSAAEGNQHTYINKLKALNKNKSVLELLNNNKFSHLLRRHSKQGIFL